MRTLKYELVLERGVSNPIPIDATGLAIIGVLPAHHHASTLAYTLERCTDRRWRCFARAAGGQVNAHDGAIVPQRITLILGEHDRGAA